MKYIIEIPDDVQYVLLNGKADNKYYTAVRPIAELEELNSDYINEHYGSLQDEAYQRGHDDGYEAGCATAFKPVSDAEYQRGYDEGYKKCLSVYDFDQPCISCDGYKRGLNDAWEAARKIIHMPEDELLNIFTECYSAVCTAVQAILKYDASEAIAKLKAYEDKRSDRIEVGDEAKWNSDVIVITRVYEDGGFNWCDGVSKDGRAYHVLLENVKKTGKHYDIQSILEAMRK